MVATELYHILLTSKSTYQIEGYQEVILLVILPQELSRVSCSVDRWGPYKPPNTRNQCSYSCLPQLIPFSNPWLILGVIASAVDTRVVVLSRYPRQGAKVPRRS